MKNEQQQILIQQHGSEKIIAALDPYVTDRRKDRIQAVLDSRLDSIHLAIEAPSDINNALAAIRSAEAMGITTIYIIAAEGDAGSIRTLTQGAYYWVNIVFYKILDDFLLLMKKQNRLLAGGVVTATQALNEIPLKNPICLMIGNEQRGLSKAAQKACDLPFVIPMHGMSESLNLSVSAAISLYDTSTRKRKLLNKLGDLNVEKSNHLKAHYYLNSVNQRLINGLLAN